MSVAALLTLQKLSLTLLACMLGYALSDRAGVSFVGSLIISVVYLLFALAILES